MSVLSTNVDLECAWGAWTSLEISSLVDQFHHVYFELFKGYFSIFVCVDLRYKFLPVFLIKSYPMWGQIASEISAGKRCLQIICCDFAVTVQVKCSESGFEILFIKEFGSVCGSSHEFIEINLPIVVWIDGSDYTWPIWVFTKRWKEGAVDLFEAFNNFFWLQVAIFRSVKLFEDLGEVGQLLLVGLLGDHECNDATLEYGRLFECIYVETGVY